MSYGRLLLPAIFVLGALPLCAQEDVSRVFDEANELFRQANQIRANDPQQADMLYRGAVLRYEHLLVERGIRNAKLYYNLGNAYHQLDDIGRAILNYRNAERLDPSDPNVLRNLNYARTRRQDRLEPAANRQILETLLFWHYEFSPAARMRLFAGAWLLLWTVLLLRLRGKAWAPREISVGLAVAAALLLGSMVYEAAVERRLIEGVVIAPDTVARQGDGQGYEPAFEDPLHAGAEFQLLEERRDWYRVQLPDGRLCWLAARDVELVL